VILISKEEFWNEILNTLNGFILNRGTQLALSTTIIHDKGL
jgi:hypothetical protein